jgi:ADP-ribose pyrophosphatase YjhB (NUDIX family)
MANKYPMSKAEFDEVYSKVPRLTVEVILKNPDGEILLTKRAIEPAKGQWHIPGGTVYFGEAVLDAVKRVAQKELSVTPIEMKNNGYIEYPSHYKNSIDCPVGLVFEVAKYEDEIKVDDEASEAKWFKFTPDNLHIDQKHFLESAGYLQARV